MRSLLSLALPFLLAAPLAAQTPQPAYPTPDEIVAAAPPQAWVTIPPEDLLVMELAPGTDGLPRFVAIQLIPAPFSQGWVENIRTLARAHWWDGTHVYRVQDNYVAQWGDVLDEKELPPALATMPAGQYEAPASAIRTEAPGVDRDSYAPATAFHLGWPVGLGTDDKAWPVHCYGTVGVARGLDNTGTGAELYAVIGHAPRQLDRNIAVVGRVIAGIEHLSSLPRGDAGDLGFYQYREQWVPILSVRLGDAVESLPVFQQLDTGSTAFADYAQARANRRDPFFAVPAGGADICNTPVPVRQLERE